MEVLTSIRWPHVPLLPAIPKAKLSTLELVSAVVSEVIPRRAAGDCINDKESEFPVKM